jgi:Na+-transporting NADH:ubiquinone oxidoreductase subunit F
MNDTNTLRLSDYSLVGKDTALAVEKGLAEATWFTPSVPRENLRELLHRKNGPAIRDTVIWFALLFASGFWGYRSWGSWWACIPFAIYGILYASVSDSRWHESLHGTAFKTDWLNNALYEVASFMVLRESTPWRWSHMRHHSDTMIVGRDPEIHVMRPPDPRKLVSKFFNLLAYLRYVRNVILHSFGQINTEERAFIPESEFPKVILKARIYALIYAAVIGLAIYLRSLLPLMFVGLPNLFGAWLMTIYGYTQHAGLEENALDHRLNSRTIYMDPINRFLYWNMNYHVEHHIFPLVPYHALPKLHDLIKHELPTPYKGIFDAYREIIPAVIHQMKDPTYHVKRVLPSTANQRRPKTVAEVISGEGRPVVDGWVEVCANTHMSVEDVVRFDFNQRTFAVYCSADGQFFASDGICTHGRTHLADGMVRGNIIECPKHNGRFDIRDGSARRRPVCVPLKTYPVRVVEGKLFLNIASEIQCAEIAGCGIEVHKLH